MKLASEYTRQCPGLYGDLTVHLAIPAAQHLTFSATVD